jgi:NAD(P)-dependent dehydrogenase (short-subunit alcohol dehydrogenase family)
MEIENVNLKNIVYTVKNQFVHCKYTIGENDEVEDNLIIKVEGLKLAFIHIPHERGFRGADFEGADHVDFYIKDDKIVNFIRKIDKIAADHMFKINFPDKTPNFVELESQWDTLPKNTINTNRHIKSNKYFTYISNLIDEKLGKYRDKASSWDIKLRLYGIKDIDWDRQPEKPLYIKYNGMLIVGKDYYSIFTQVTDKSYEETDEVPDSPECINSLIDNLRVDYLNHRTGNTSSVPWNCNKIIPIPQEYEIKYFNKYEPDLLDRKSPYYEKSIRKYTTNVLGEHVVKDNFEHFKEQYFRRIGATSKRIIETCLKANANNNNKCRFFIAGGSVIGTMVDWEFGDSDIFVLENGESPQTVHQFLENTLLSLDKMDIGKYVILKNNFTLNIIPENGKDIQFILRRVCNKEELLMFFDLDCCRFGFDEKGLFTTPEGLESLRTGKNICNNNEQISDSRIKKYLAKGMKITFSSKRLTKSAMDLYPSLPSMNYSEITPDTKIKDNTVCYDFNSVYIDRTLFFTQGYYDKHLWLKYRISRCYMTGVYFKVNDYDNDLLIPKYQFTEEGHALNTQPDISNFKLDGYVSIVTGGRIKIGYKTALILLRAGSTVVVTSRFQKDTYDRYKQEKDFDDFKNRLHIYSLNLKDKNAILKFVSWVNTSFTKINILINNAAQTIRRPLYYYKNLILNEINYPKTVEDKHEDKSMVLMKMKELSLTKKLPDSLAVMFLDQHQDDTNCSARDFPDLTDEYGEQVDYREKHTWHLNPDEIDPLEHLEVQMINNIAPTLITNYLNFVEGKSYVINVTSIEGQFNITDPKDFKHIHTNISKAALNMLTKSSSEYFAKKGVMMNGCDTGWVSSAINTWKPPPLTTKDGAFRILYPIIINSREYGKIWKNYQVCPY